MFNEAFWFFYWVGVVDELKGVATAIAWVTLIGSIISVSIGFVEDNKGAKNLARTGAFAFLVSAGLIVTVPSKEALYAGAAQYVGEATEVDETLIRLKTLLDEKLDELAAEDSESD